MIELVMGITIYLTIFILGFKPALPIILILFFIYWFKTQPKTNVNQQQFSKDKEEENI